MEAFQLLSRGGAKFNKQRFKSDFQLFDGKEHMNGDSSQSKVQNGEVLPPELDFFKYTSSGHGKRKATRTESVNAQESGDEEGTKKRVKVDEHDKGEGPSKPRHRVTSKGIDIPPPIDSFELPNNYDASPLLIKNLRESGYITPTAIQAHCASIMLNGRDLAAISPTGTGKTLAYLFPIMALLKSPISNIKDASRTGVRAIVVAPTRELAHQIHNECLKLAQGRKWKIVLFSKATANTLSDKDVRAKVDIIVSTPLRLVDAIQKGILELDNVQHLILDEADRLLDSEFITQTKEIISSCTHTRVQKAVFSATLPAGAEKIAMESLRNPIRVVVGLKDTPLPSISQSLTYVADDYSKLPTLLQYLSLPYKPPVVVFTSTQPRASSLAEQLVLNNIPNVDCLHAGMSQKEREAAITRMRQGESWIMISTEVMARGLDFKGVQGVINFDFPPSVQSYVHRIGRTGRAGREGTAITYFTNEDAPFLKPIANVLLQSGSTVPEWILKLPKPSKMKRREMGKVNRGKTVTKDGRIGRNDAIKRRAMIQASKRRQVRKSTGHEQIEPEDQLA